MPVLPSLIAPFASTLVLAILAGIRDYGAEEDAAHAVGSVVGALIFAFGVVAIVRAIQRRGGRGEASPFWTPGWTWAAFGLLLLATLGQVAQSTA